MKIHTVWAVRKCNPGEPELVTAWDEFSVDANSEGFEEDVKKSLESWGDDLLAFRRIDIRVSYPGILQAFDTTEITGVIT
jgi:hypothetical protein